MPMTWSGNVRGQQSLVDFTAAMEAAGLLVRMKDEKRVDQLPLIMEQYPKQAVLVERITGCEFSFLANAYATHEQYAWALGCKVNESGAHRRTCKRTHHAGDSYNRAM
jgi:2,5-furandicarboxylate decarboxylase 1